MTNRMTRIFKQVDLRSRARTRPIIFRFSLAARQAERNTGFTLIEILLVVVIIGILVAVVMPRLTGRGKEAEISAAKSSIANISLSLDLYEVDNGAYPATLQSLLTKTSELNWRGPYLRKDALPVDPWGKQFVYTLQDNGYELRSAGPNGTSGDGDDITN